MADRKQCVYKKDVELFFKDPKNLSLGEHIASCSQCLARYLSLVEKEAIKAPDLRTPIMEKISRFEEKKRQEKRLMVVRYAVAASLAFMLWQGGVFNKIAESGIAGTSYFGEYTAQKNEDFQDLRKEQKNFFDIINEKLFWRNEK